MPHTFAGTHATAGGSSIATVAGPADANQACATNTRYIVDISGYTADRTYTLPASPAVGDFVGILLTVASASYELIITAHSGQTLNGITGGSEWSRIFIANEAVGMRCVATNTWVVELDGRIPEQCLLRLSTNATGESAATVTVPTTKGGAWTADVDIGSMAGVSTSIITTRRAGKFNLTITGRAATNITAAKFYILAYKNSGLTSSVLQNEFVPGASSQGALAAGLNNLPLVVGDFVQFAYYSDSGSIGLLSAAAPTYTTSMALMEVLP